MISALGIPHHIATIIMGVFVASFAGTSLDTSARLQRFFISELLPEKSNPKFKNRYFLSAVVVISAAILAYSTGSDGKGALTLWPLFGAANQLMAALALTIITIFLKQNKNRYWLAAGLPALFMCVMTIWAAIKNFFEFEAQHNILLVLVNIIIVVLSVIVFISGLIKLKKTTK